MTDGYRRLALVVGVGEYKNRKVTQLKGPPNDARRVYDLLTGKNGYGFPKENVCLLLDGQATTEHFREDFDRALVERAQAGDVAVFYFAGHGSQTRDKNGDEPSGWDDTLMFQDARTDGIHDLVDDEFHEMLARLQQKTEHVVVILDSCNSGTAARADDAGTFVARFQPPAEDSNAPQARGHQGGGSGGAVPEDIPGLIALTAATDGTSALETAGRGVFTDALVQVLSRVGENPLTYAQVARQVPPLVAATSYQIPYFHGDLSGPVFGNVTRKQPIAWEVNGRGPPLQLAGPPLPGMGQGAELRVYDGRVSGPDTADPTKAKATVVVTRMTGLNAEAQVSVRGPRAQPIASGDLAVLVRPADESLKIKVRLRPAKEPGGLPEDRARTLAEAIARDPEAALLVEATDGPGDYELSLDDGLVLRGPENTVRNVYRDDKEVPKSLWQHARQRALLQLHGEGGRDFSDNQTLRVQLVPAARQKDRARGQWQQAPPNTEQVMPLCHSWNVRVELAKDAPTPLLVGGVVLSTDGSLFGFPFDGRKVPLRPGEHVTFDAQHETFTASPPLDVQDHLIVFGTQETNPVPWHLLTDTAATRAAGPPMSGLYRALDRYLRPGSRGQREAAEEADETTWTLSHLTMRVRANPP